MTTDVHGGHGADAPATHPDGPPGSDLLLFGPVPPYVPGGAADTALLPAVVDEETTEPAAPNPATPAPSDAAPQRPDCVVGPLASVGDLCRWLSAACDRAGQPSSVTLSGPGRDAVVNFNDSATFLRWCDWYGVGALNYTSDYLGESAEGITTISGWVLRVRLSGPAVEELP